MDAFTQTKFSLEEIVGALTGTALVHNWSECLEHSQLSMERQVSLKKWISEYRDQFVEQLRDIEYEEQLETMLALRYIEIRANWNGINTQIQFQMFRGQEPDSDLLARGSLISSMITELEKFIGVEDKDQVDTFLDSPLIGDGVGLIKVDSNKVTILGPNRVLIQKGSA
ncbi:MAG: hypothetical protein NXI24_18165 [bacterium]|nr:hypothetical protein [bacterium]